MISNTYTRMLAPIIFGTMRLHKNKILALSFLILLLVTTDGFSQATFDERLISTEKELNFTTTDKRGIKGEEGIIFLVERDGQTLTAYDGEKIKWTVNIIKVCGEPKVGKPQIRYLKLTADKIEIIFGKHSFASVDVADGKATYLGAD